MTIKRAFLLLMAVTGSFAILGTLIGWLIGRYNPTYYRTVFRGGREPSFDPVEMGIGLGLSQGVVGGVVIALVLIGILVWRETRLRRASENPEGLPARRSRLLYVLLAGVGFVGLVLSCLCGGLLGTTFTEMSVRERQFYEQSRIVEPILRSDPAFKNVGIDDGASGTGEIYLTGYVETSEDEARLRELLTKAIGEKKTQQAFRGFSRAYPRKDPPKQDDKMK